ncbi:MAG: RNA polymerase sigma factor [Myxococcales bacterium]|nr:RNA polymerase sigma factor [Myxococcales bacterium]MCB9641832.1 RNA polymerase sigma factor [Myxococcales bacterium]
MAQGISTPAPHAKQQEKPLETQQGSNEEEQEKALVQKAQAGDKAAFQHLLRLYTPRLFRRLLRMTRDLDQAEDCLQQGLLRAIEQLGTYRKEGCFYAWLASIVTNEVLQLFRKHGRERAFLADFSVFFHRSKEASNQPLPEQLFLQEERREIVHHALERLDAQKRIVILLCDLEGERLEDVALQLGIPKGTVASRLHHARRELHGYITFELKRCGISAEEWFHA